MSKVFTFIALFCFIYTTPIILLWHRISVTVIYSISSLPKENLYQASAVFSNFEDSWFTPNEIDHLDDVRRLIYFSRITLILSLLLLALLWFLHRRRHTTFKFLKHLKSMSLLSFWGSIIIVIFFFLFWEFAFVSFHQLFFPQGNWAFPADSLLINLYPNIFWQSAFGLYFLLVLLIAGCVWLLAKLIQNPPYRHQSF